VPNPDGTPFYGSSTKLFEYMATAKAIAASDLGQIGEVLTHDRDALLTAPGNAKELARTILRLAADAALRKRLGDAARERVLQRYTWDRHVDRILRRLAADGEPGR
jgi:glycosyltransferase involved in cell wall biosynthesis